nr:protein Bouncer-like isoform X1 [Misgurnus anguillicaudatus]
MHLVSRQLIRNQLALLFIYLRFTQLDCLFYCCNGTKLCSSQQVKDKICPNITTACRPHERCFSSRGRYGRVHVLSGQGCVAEELCDSHQTLIHMSVAYNVTYMCCCYNLCNDAPTADNLLKQLLGLTTAPANNISNAHPFNLCPEN